MAKNESVEEIDLVGDAGGRRPKKSDEGANMVEYTTEGVSSQYLFMGWYSFE
jgi:hypothetical protein